MPDLIETRPFTIHPELYAWPSFRVFTDRTAWIYPLVAGIIAVLFWGGMRTSTAIAILLGVGITALFVGLNFARYRNFLRRPENREIYRNCVVSLTRDEVRQDFTDGSHMAMKFFAIKRFREVGDFFFVFASVRNGIVVPKTAFESPDEAREFAARIRAAIK